MGDKNDSRLIAFDIRSVTIDETTARLTIPSASQCITDGGQTDDIVAKVKVEETDDTIRVTAEIDK